MEHVQKLKEQFNKQPFKVQLAIQGSIHICLHCLVVVATLGKRSHVVYVRIQVECSKFICQILVCVPIGRFQKCPILGSML